MKTYQVFKGKNLVGDKVTASQLFSFIPAGSELTSGNTVRQKNKPGGGLETTTEIKATYKIPCNGGHVTIIQNQ